MKKEQLVTLGLTDEQILEVFKINGLDIENAKSELESYQSQVETLKGQLTDANDKIEEFKDLDVDGIRQASEEYKTQFEEAKIKSEEDIQALKFNYEIENAIRDSKARNVVAVKALLDTETLKGSNNRDKDLAAALEDIKTSNDYLFEGEVAQGTGGSLGAGSKAKVSAVSTEEFDKMGYKERVELKNTNAELYEQLSN